MTTLVPVLYALAGAVAVILMVRQVLHAEKQIRKAERAGVFELILVGVVLPGFFVAMFGWTQVGIGFWGTLSAWALCAVGGIEVATWGRPHLLGQWLEHAADKRWMLPFGRERVEYLRIGRLARPYRRYFLRWLPTVPVAFLSAMALMFLAEPGAAN